MHKLQNTKYWDGYKIPLNYTTKFMLTHLNPSMKNTTK